MSGGLLRITHFRGRGWCRLDFLEAGKRAQAGRFGLTGAATGRGQECENGSDECGENTNHGVGCGRFEWNGWRWEALPTMELNPGTGMGILFRGLDVSRLVRRRRGTAGSGKKGRSGSDKGEFHLWANGLCVGNRHEAHASLAARLAGRTVTARQKTRQKSQRVLAARNRW